MIMDGKYVDGSFYFYDPNKGAAVFFTIAFFVSGVLHVWQTTHYKCWILTPLFPFCCLLFAAGFALREYGAFHYDSLNAFIASVCITYAAPPLLELQNYHMLGRILYHVPHHSPMHPGRVLTTFGFVSTIIEALNGWGAPYSSNQSLTEAEIAAGHALIKTSLILQLAVISCFVWLTAVFHRRCYRAGAVNAKVTSSLVTLYISTGLIQARTIYRTVEYFGVTEYRFTDPGFNPESLSPTIRYEVFFYMFEASLMLINCCLFNLRHPRRYLPRNNKIFMAQDGITEIEGPGLKDPRPFWQTVIDPFDIVGLTKGVNHQAGKFWDSHTGTNETTKGSSPRAAANEGSSSLE